MNGIKKRIILKFLEKKQKKLKKEMEKQKMKGGEEKTKKRLIEAIMGMTEFYDLYEDDEQTIPTTTETLEKKDINSLITQFEEIMEETKNAIKETGGKK